MSDAKFDTYKEPYVYVWGEKGNGYAHVYVRIFNICNDGYGYLDRDVRLEASCQVGGEAMSSRDGTYAYRYGITGGREMLSLGDLEQGVKYMRKFEKRINTIINSRPDTRSLGNTFAEFAMSIITASGVKDIFVNENFARGFSCAMAELPRFSPDYVLFGAISKLEGEAIKAVTK